MKDLDIIIKAGGLAYIQGQNAPSYKIHIFFFCYIRCWGQIFHTTWLHFIGDLHHVNTIMDFGRISSKAQKSPYLHKKTSKPMVQAHSTSSHFLAHNPSSWVSLGEYWELWFEGPRSMFSKVSVVQSW